MSKKYAYGGDVFSGQNENTPPNTYPFASQGLTAEPQPEPSVNVGNSQTQGVDPTQINSLPSYNAAFKKGGKVSSASKRGDGIASKGKTRGMLR
jgi:hypothetical protein